MATHNTWERLGNAVEYLASTQDKLQERLSRAFWAYLSALQVKDFPEELKEEFSKIREEMLKEEPFGAERNIESTTKVMTDEKAEEIAKNIFNLYDQITRNYCTPDEY